MRVTILKVPFVLKLFGLLPMCIFKSIYMINTNDQQLTTLKTQVIMKFSEPVWPRDLHGMIMVDDDFLLPEVWFRNVEDEVSEGEPATAYAVGFTTAKYAERVAGMTQEEVSSC